MEYMFYRSCRHDILEPLQELRDVAVYAIFSWFSVSSFSCFLVLFSFLFFFFKHALCNDLAVKFVSIFRKDLKRLSLSVVAEDHGKMRPGTGRSSEIDKNRQYRAAS